jgi:hypothetical protein
MTHIVRSVRVKRHPHRPCSLGDRRRTPAIGNAEVVNGKAEFTRALEAFFASVAGFVLPVRG